MIQSDSLRSLISGMGDPNRDKAASEAMTYFAPELNDLQLDQAFKASWIARKIVAIPAEDSLRKWRFWIAEQEQITAIEKEERRLGIKLKLLQCKTLARLWGGAAIFIGDGNPADQPIDPLSIGLGGIKYLTVMSRREISVSELEEDPTLENYGKPRKYTISTGKIFADIHPSRMIVQIGDIQADPWNATGQNYGWGDSTLQSAFSAITQADAASANIASLLFEANVDVIGIPGLTELVATAADRTSILTRLTLAAAGKSIAKTLVMDSEEEYTRNPINFTGLPDVMQTFLLNVSGAADIPLTRFLGQSPAGLSSTGEGDMKNYYDRIQSVQELEITPACALFDECLIASALGSRPAEIFYKWAPLEQMSEKEIADIGKVHADTAQVLNLTGLFMPEELRQVVGNQFVEDGLYPGLADLLKANGDTIPDFDLETRAKEAAVKTAENPPKPAAPKKFGDATPRTLYMRRDVVNGAQIAKWFTDQGVQDVYTPEQMHVTVVYSKTPVDWMKFGESWAGTLEVPAGGPRMMEKFGDANDTLVLLFQSSELNYRASVARDLGATSDHDEYQSHITISASDQDVSQVQPYQGPITLGPEIFEEVLPPGVDWRTLAAGGK